VHIYDIQAADTARTRKGRPMAIKLTKDVVAKLEPPAKGNKITYDSEVSGFGVRVTANGARSFILNYRTRAGRERRYTIGDFPTWTVPVARDEAKELKRRVDKGEDPLGDITVFPTVNVQASGAISPSKVTQSC